ncbi:MAG: hypothetical protein J5769_01885 [Bacteroidales bacterium]|nr:hypothetical protein [Bacteroidales bacterium]
MKNLHNIAIIAAAALILALPACSIKEDNPWEVPGISLSFFSEEDFQVKATVDSAGIEALNENVLASVEYFLYQDGRTDQDAVWHGYLTNVRPLTSYSVPMTDDVVTMVLCPNNAEYFYVYAIANHPRIVADPGAGGTEDLTHTSVPELEARTQELEFVTSGENEGNVETTQSKFLMASDGPLKVGPIKRRQTTVASARVNLKRSAAKISVLVRVAQSVTITNKVTIGTQTITRDEIWTPRTNEMTVYLVNGAKTGLVSGLPQADPELFSYQPLEFDKTKGERHSYYSYELRTNDDGDPVDEHGNVINEENPADPIYDEVQSTGTFYPCVSPFYSYPQQWSYGSDEEPYLKLVIPWDRQPGDGFGATQKQYYYRVYCPASSGPGTTYDAEFLRNHWYKVILNVGILGSETDGGEIIINGSYYVADWQERDTGSQDPEQPGQETGVNDSDKEAEIKGARYLFVNKQEFELFNVNELVIPYITSDPCEIVNMQAKKYIFSGTTKAESTTTNLADWGMDLRLITTANGAHVSFNHRLNNDTSTSDYDVSEYIITFTLRQADNAAYSKNIVIHQYPAIMIDLENNDVTTSPYSAFVNNSTNTSNSNSTYYLGSAPGSGTSSNNNYNMVIIQTTVLPSDSDYMLGDPRVSDIDNLKANWPSSTTTGAASEWSVSAASIQGGNNRYLTYYYPVNRLNSADNIIAPKFRIASSRGATQQMTYANAFRRCASYQEYGYPAGRWRLPTVAEVMYIAQLNADGKIERLLGGETIKNNNNQSMSETWQASKTTSYCHTEYWCNSGYMIVYDGKDSNWVTNNGGKVPSPEMGGSYSTSDKKYVRCVYDDWYWEDMTLNGNDVSQVTPKTTFKWGDMPR